MAVRYCRCGQVFDTQGEIVEHIGLCNPHWPRTRPDDEHVQITTREWMELHGNMESDK